MNNSKSDNRGQLSPFESIEYKVGIYQTVSEPYRLAVNIESSANCEFKTIKLGERNYIYKKIWEFEGPRKAVYSSIMNKLYSGKITPYGGTDKMNPNHKAIYDIPSSRYDDIEFIIDTIISGLTVDPITKRTKFSVIVNDSGSGIDEIAGLMRTFTRTPSAMIIPSGPITRKNQPTYVEFAKAKEDRHDRSSSANWRHDSINM